MSKIKVIKFDVEVVEKIIGVPITKWRGCCHEIAELMLKRGLVKGKLRYGHWTGIVLRGSIFENYPRGVVRHGWIELPNGKIVDPTRFDFEQKPPYIYVGRNDYYDAGGNQHRLEQMTSPPPFSHTEKQVKLSIGDKTSVEFMGVVLKREVRDKQVTITIKQAFWLANLPIQILGEAGKSIYQALIEADLEALIPIDNRQIVLGDEPKRRSNNE